MGSTVEECPLAVATWAEGLWSALGEQGDAQSSIVGSGLAEPKVGDAQHLTLVACSICYILYSSDPAIEGGTLGLAIA